MSIERNNAIGIFDSGFGGLSLVKEIFKQMPNEEVIYFADTARCPYGTRPFIEVRRFVFEIIEFLHRKNVKLIAIACNTATAASLESAHRRFSIPIVGVINPGAESAIKATKNKRIGVIATKGTIKSKAYRIAIGSLSSDALVINRECQKLVEFIEKGKTEGEKVEEVVVQCISPLLKEDIDTLVLGCTHFPFVEDIIKKVVGDKVTIVNPAIQMVEHINNIMQSNRLNRVIEISPTHQFFTTGKIDEFKILGEKLLKKSMKNLRHVEVQDISNNY